MYPRNRRWILYVVIAVIVLAALALLFFLVILPKISAPATPPIVPPAATPAAAPLSSSYPLAGTIYSSPQGHEYDARWESNGRLWQPSLPSGNQRVAHSVAFTILPGSYTFNGVACRLYVDNARNGKGSQNPITAANVNGASFSVNTADNGNAFALVECDGGASSGFEIFR